MAELSELQEETYASTFLVEGRELPITVLLFRFARDEMFFGFGRITMEGSFPAKTSDKILFAMLDSPVEVLAVRIGLAHVPQVGV